MAEESPGPVNGVVVRFKFEAAHALVAWANGAEPTVGQRFWTTALVAHGDGVSASEAETYRRRIERSFGPRLHRLLRLHAGRQSPLGGVAIAVRSVDYGSLDLVVLIEGLDKLARAFDDYFPAFRVALEQYAPDALADSIEEDDLDVTCRIDNVQDVASAFAAAGQPKEAVVATASKEDKDVDKERLAGRIKWAWIVSNTSLILPVLLALYVVQVVHAELGERGRRLDEREAALIKSYGDRQDRLDAVLVEAVKASASASARSNCCCRACPPLRAASTPARARPCGECG